MAGPTIPLTLIQASYISNLLSSAVSATIDPGQVSQALVLLDPNNAQCARKVVQITSAYDGTNLYIYKLCDDGTIYQCRAGADDSLLSEVAQGATRNVLLMPEISVKAGLIANATVISINRLLAGYCIILSNSSGALYMTNRLSGSCTLHTTSRGALTV